LSRPISIAAATWSRVADGFDKTAETASHFVDALSRSPVHPVNAKANSRAMILIRAVYPDSDSVSDFLWAMRAYRDKTLTPFADGQAVKVKVAVFRTR
jgi:hypothetical protein